MDNRFPGEYSPPSYRPDIDYFDLDRVSYILTISAVRDTQPRSNQIVHAFVRLFLDADHENKVLRRRCTQIKWKLDSREGRVSGLEDMVKECKEKIEEMRKEKEEKKKEVNEKLQKLEKRMLDVETAQSSSEEKSELPTWSDRDFINNDDDEELEWKEEEAEVKEEVKEEDEIEAVSEGFTTRKRCHTLNQIGFHVSQ